MSDRVYVVMWRDAPFPVTVTVTPELAQAYIDALYDLPKGHVLRPFRPDELYFDECPLLDALPESLGGPAPTEPQKLAAATSEVGDALEREVFEPLLRKFDRLIRRLRRDKGRAGAPLGRDRG